MKAGKKLVGALSYFGGSTTHPAETPKLDQKPLEREELPPADQDQLPAEDFKQTEDSIASHLASIDQKLEGTYDFIDVSSVPLTEETITSLNTQLLSLEDINEFLFKIGCCFVGNKSQLALWIKGLQGSFAHLYVLSKLLLSEAKELITLKDFLVITVENLKQRIHDLMNEKEDLAAMH